MSAATSTHSGAGPLGLMSCVRESSPLQDFDSDNEKSVATKKKMSWNPKKWFKRRNKCPEDSVLQSEVTEISKDPLRSRSTSELSVSDEPIRRRSGSTMQAGLSVSHDSVFHSPQSGSESELDAAQSSSSLCIPQPHVDNRFQTELTERLRLRRHRGDTSEDDEGLPHSPCNSPSTADGFLDKTANKDLPTKSHSTCSDGSLLSMCSSDMEEDSCGQHSRHSSRQSLSDKKSPDKDSDLDLSLSAVPLNHSAAHHKVAVRPKRTHGAPRRKRVQQLSNALPTTPEVNEDSSLRSVSPETITRETVTEHYSMSTTKISSETKTKSASLPLGSSAPNTENKLSRSQSNAQTKQEEELTTLEEELEVKAGGKSFFERIMPRRSGKKKKVKEERITKEEKHFTSTIDSVMSSSMSSSYTRSSHESTSLSYGNLYSPRTSETKPIAAPRTGALARQRIQPMDLPASPEPAKRESHSVIHPKASPEKSLGSSPLNQELENRFRQNRLISASPPKSSDFTVRDPPPLSPKTPRSSITPAISKLDYPPLLPRASITTTTAKHVETKREFHSEETKRRSEDIRSKMKIAGLSSLHEKILASNDEPDEATFKSLTDFSTDNEDTKKFITKSHSFKCNKANFKDSSSSSSKFVMSSSVHTDRNESAKTKEKRKSIVKASSLDSVKNLEEPQVTLDLNMKIPADKQVLKDSIISEIQEEIMKNHIKKESSDSLKKERKHVSETHESHQVYQSKTEKVYSFVESTKKIETDKFIKQIETNLQSLTDHKLPNIDTKKHDIDLEPKKKVEVEKKNEPLKKQDSCEKSDDISEITISGPRHTAVVNINTTNNTLSSMNFIDQKTEDSSELLKSYRTEKDITEKEVTIKEQVTVTNVQLKRESNQVTHSSYSVQKSNVPEFINRQLNKVECKPTSTVVCSVNSPRIIDEQSRPKTLTLFDQDFTKPSVRKFSKEDIEIIEKSNDNSPVEPNKSPVIVSSMTPLRFTKPDVSKNYQRKSSVVLNSENIKTEKPYSRLRSSSLDSLKSDMGSSDKSSQDSLDKLDDFEPPKTPSEIIISSVKRSSPTSETPSLSNEGVTMRKKSFPSGTPGDDQPELMKVFARRSLKLKDSDCDVLSQQVAVMIAENKGDNKTRDSDKENQTDSPVERKKSIGKDSTKEPLAEVTEVRKTFSSEVFKSNETVKNKEVIRTTFSQKSNEVSTRAKQEQVQHTSLTTEQSQSEQKVVGEKKKEDDPEDVTLRKNPLNNKLLQYQRAVSMQTAKTNENSENIRKQSSFLDRRKTDNWLSNLKNEEKKVIDDQVTKSEIITEELISESKNFNQRKAIWEKRAQESQKKTVP